MTKNIQITLVRAENPANIGQAARAMKNFGFSRLALVDCAPHQVQEAYTLGWNAREVLDNAKVFNSTVGAGEPRPLGQGEATSPLQQAIADSVLTIGLTRRSGHARGEPRPFTEIIPQILEAAQSHTVSFLFGNEKNGLSNGELQKCHLAALFPTAQEHGSLNLSHAVAIACFLIFNQMPESVLNLKKPERYYATQAELALLLSDFKEVLETLDYKDDEFNDLLTRTLKNFERLFKKAGLERREFHMFKAFLSRIAQKTEQRDFV